MKKIVFTFVLSLVLSVSGFADGVTHDGGRSCPQEQTCYTDSNTATKQPNNSVPRSSKITVSNLQWIDFRNFYLFLKSIIK
jgi:hypothetical protein